VSLREETRSSQYIFGRFAIALYLSALIGIGWLALQVDLFPNLLNPVTFIVVFGLAGLLFAFASGGLSIELRPLKLTAALTVLAGIGIISALTILISIFPPAQTPVLSVLAIGPIAGVMFLSFIGAHEEAMWGGLYVFFRRVFPGYKSFLVILLINFLGGMAYHQAVGRQLFAGGIFDVPSYFIWIGISWVLYRVVLEVTKSFGLAMGIHMGYNAFVAYQSGAAL
jgi:hypothetical protein